MQMFNDMTLFSPDDLKTSLAVGHLFLTQNLKRVLIYDFAFDVCKYMILALMFVIYDNGKYIFGNNIFGFDVKNI